MLPLHDTATARVKAGIALGWLGFVLLMVTIGVQEELSEGRPPVLWRPLVAEGTSLGVATLIAWLQWRRAAHLDHLLDRPLRWFTATLAWALPTSVIFVGVVYGLRHVIFNLAGAVYRHPPWPEVLVYESLKFLLFYALFTGVQFGVRSYLAWNAERLRAERHQALSQQAQLLQLTQQLQPHFLFNALNTVVVADPHRPRPRRCAADALGARCCAPPRDAAERPEHTLADELALLEAYAAIMVERFGDRVRIALARRSAARATAACRRSALQPLLENCFRHAVERAARDRPRSSCAHERAGERLRVEVDDDGGRARRPRRCPASACATCSARLQVLHGDAAALRAARRATAAACARRLELPCAC